MFEEIIRVLTEILDRIIYVIPALIISFTVHEFMHAFASYKLGDPTAKEEGRLTLNPLKHIDVLGFLFIVVFGFGWAKPVPVRLQWYDKPKRDFALVSAAGPVSNLLLAVVGTFLYAGAQLFYTAVDLNVDTVSTFGTVLLAVAEYLVIFFYALIQLNVMLAIFNLIPFPPLDGSRIVMSFLPSNLYSKILYAERWLFIVLIALLTFGVLDAPLSFLCETVTNPLMEFAYIIYSAFEGFLV